MTARRLAGNVRRTAILYTCNRPPCDQLAQVLKTNLASIGIDLQIKALPVSGEYSGISRARGSRSICAFLGGWVADYKNPATR